jgi:hypothetical protein
MTIYVEIDAGAGQRSGDWIVKNGSGRGARIISRHRTKAAAKKKARSEAHKRDTGLRIQNTDGTWKQ